MIKINLKTIGTPKEHNYGSLLHQLDSRKNQNDTFIPYLWGQMFAVGYVTIKLNCNLFQELTFSKWPD